MNWKPAKGWDEFFFSPVDPRVYAGLRLATGAMLVIHLAVLAPNWLLWFSDEGLLDRDAARANLDPDAHSLFFWLSGNPTVMWTCFTIIFIQVLALTLGLASRFNAACVFVWLVSLHHRNNLIWEGEDLLLRILCFLLIFMPAGRCWSLDALIRNAKTPAPKDSAPAPRATVWPLRLLQLELTFLYLSSVVQKLNGEAWRDGTAIQYVLRLDDVSGHRIPMENLFLHDPIAYQIATWSTIGIELMLAFLVWLPPVRRAVVGIGIAFHLGIELTMDLFMFQWLMILILATHLVTPLGKTPAKISRAAS